MKKNIKSLFSVKFFWFIRALIYKLIFGKFGNLSYLGKPKYIINPKKIFIGQKVRILPGLRIEANGKSKITIKDNVSIGHNVHITSFEDLLIGSGTTIAGNVLIMSLIHDVKIKDTPYMDQPLKGKKTNIGENCLIGSNSAIMAGTSIGNQCIVASNSVVTKGCYDDYSIIAGNPAKIIKKIDFETEI